MGKRLAAMMSSDDGAGGARHPALGDGRPGSVSPNALLDEPPRRVDRTLVIVAILVLAAGPATIAQDSKPYPLFTADHFVGAMKTAGQAFAAVNASLTRNEIEDAKAYLAISRDRLATTITFWRDRRKDDAIKMLRETVATLDALDAALSMGQVDRTVVAALVKQTGAACQTCHAAFRDQDPVTKAYRFRTGLVQ